jgi:hypothetical protein
MRVLHVIPSIGPFRGGPSAVLCTMAHYQAERGFEAHFATTDDNGPERLARPGEIPLNENVT